MDRNTAVEPTKISPEEEDRLTAPSDVACPNCGGHMSVGDHEAGGICSACYWVALYEVMF